MNLTWSTRVIKYLMFGFNLLFVITGIIILAIGVTTKTFYMEYVDVLDSQYFTLPNLLIAIGSIIFFISFLGCCGALKESWLMLYAFSGFLILIFILELSAGIAGYALRNKTYEYLDTVLHNSMSKYNTTANKSWDLIQTEFKCCGVDNYTDWKPTFNNGDLPVSCCPSKQGIVGVFYCNINIEGNLDRTKRQISLDLQDGDKTTTATTPDRPPTATTTLIPTTSKPYKIGCKEGFGNFVRAHAADLGGVGIALAIIQIVGIAFSIHLAKSLKRGYSST